MPLPRNVTAGLIALLLLSSASTAAAADDGWQWDGSRAEQITATTIDLLIVRPLATARVAVGTVLMLPAMLLASPGGREGIDGAYDVFMVEPAEYAFRREIGKF